MFDLTLTFDDGPQPDVTPFVLETLSKRGLKATFFVIGEKLRRNRDLVERARADGHWIGNHTWTHSIPLGDREGPETVEVEVQRAQDELGELVHPDKFFRPFAFGKIGPRLLNPRVVEHLRDNAFTCVLWNAVPEEWLDPEGWVERAVGMCLAKPWTMLVLHDLPTGAMKHLPRFLDTVAEAGARFRQDMPPDCLPVRRGEILMPLAPYVAGGWPYENTVQGNAS